MKEQDVVSILPNATYYDGKNIPDWVKQDKWIISHMSGDRAVIDKNVSHTKSIISPINVKFLQVVQEGANPETPSPMPSAPVPKKTPQSSGNSNMSISNSGVDLVAKYEGCRLEAYRCPAGVWTIGYGHTHGVKPGDRMPSVEVAKTLLKQDLQKYGNYVNTARKNGAISFPLSQGQFDALTSFCYNCGNGNLLKLVKGRDAKTIADKMLQYNKGGGRELAGLTRRRNEERNLFLS